MIDGAIIEKMVDFHGRGINKSMIARMLGVSRSSVHRHLKKETAFKAATDMYRTMKAITLQGCRYFTISKIARVSGVKVVTVRQQIYRLTRKKYLIHAKEAGKKQTYRVTNVDDFFQYYMRYKTAKNI